MHARYYSGNMGRFLSADPKVRRASLMQSGRWNRYAYALGSPVIYTDPDGLDVIYGHPADKKFYEKAAKRNYRVRAVLDAFAPGTGRDLIIQRGDPGAHPVTGEKRAGVTVSTYSEATPEEIREAYANGGEAAAQALIDEGEQLTEAEITLIDNASAREKLHELGHVEQDLLDPAQSIKDAEAALQATTSEAYRNSRSEQYAEEFAEDARKKNPTPP